MPSSKSTQSQDPAVAAAASKSSSSTTNSKEKTTVETLEEELSRAETAVRNNEFKVTRLHQQWTTYLVRLSYMVLFIAFHQLQNPSTACLKDAKEFNKEVKAVGGDDSISGVKVIGLVLTDCLVHVLAIVMACFLSFFLTKQQQALAKGGRFASSTDGGAQKKKDDDADVAPKPNQLKRPTKKALFSDPRYLMANACIAPLLAMYFAQRKPESSASCLNTALLQKAGVTPQARERTLPVAVVFHVLVTLCILFMDRQQTQVATNVNQVLKLRDDLLVAQAQEKLNQQRKQQEPVVSRKK